MSYGYLDVDMSLSHNVTMMSIPQNAAMSLPYDAAMSYDLTMTLPINSGVACDEESNPVVTFSQSFEVDTSVGNPVAILSETLMTAIEGDDFLLCSASARNLSRRTLEECVVLGVKIDSMTDSAVQVIKPGKNFLQA